MKNNAWEAYLYEKHSRATIYTWARELRYFRFCRATGGHGREDDRLHVAIGFHDRNSLVYAFHRLCIPLVILPPDEPQPVAGRAYQGDELLRFRIGAEPFPDIKQPGLVRVQGVLIYAMVYPGRLEIEISDEEYYEVTERAVASAKMLEVSLAAMADSVIDPPMDNNHCICPKYYPGIWS